MARYPVGRITGPVKYLRDCDYWLWLLRSARCGGVDEVDRLRAYYAKKPRQDWPDMVRDFLDTYKRPPHRAKSPDAQRKKFYRDPNRVAAAYAAAMKAAWKRKGGRGYKIVLPDGSKATANPHFARTATEVVNASFKRVGSRQRAQLEQVEELLRRRKVQRPGT